MFFVIQCITSITWYILKTYGNKNLVTVHENIVNRKDKIDKLLRNKKEKKKIYIYSCPAG